MTRTTRRGGFTLIELLVAVSLFAIAVAIAAGGFVRALRTQRQLIALISANSSASLAVEQMAREIRTGTTFDCSGVAGTCGELTFTNAQGEQVHYYAQDGVLERQTGALGTPRPLTPADTQIQNLSFYLLGSAIFPPRITIVMGVTAKSYGLEGSVTGIQTTVSSRNL